MLDMKYDGADLRSKRRPRSWVDRVWSFFASVKVGLWLIALIIAGSAVGTIFPQEMYIPQQLPASQYYTQEYGSAGTLYYTLGFHNLYTSWWYIGLIVMLTLSLIVVSIDRFFPLYKALKNQPVRRTDRFMRGQRLTGEGKGSDEQIDALGEALKAKRYQVKRDGDALLAEKHRFGRWGPYVNHIGLVIFFVGAMLRVFPAFYTDTLEWVREGDTVALEATEDEYYLRNDQFILEMYDPENNEEDAKFAEAIEKAGAVPKNYETELTLFKKTGTNDDGSPVLEEVEAGSTKVNHPFKFDKYEVYQEQYSSRPEFLSMSFSIGDKETGELYGPFTVDLDNPETTYALGEVTVSLKDLYPDFEVRNGVPDTKSPRALNPAFFFTVDTPEGTSETNLIGIRMNVADDENRYAVQFAGTEMASTSGLRVKSDSTYPILILGGTIFMIGIVMGMYWPHRRVWVRRHGETDVLVAGFTNKNPSSLRREVSPLLEKAGLPIWEDQAMFEKQKDANSTTERGES
ncbi:MULTISPECIES: cytochrome c biogenesis protein ResB [Exiguobacterium]|uniref:cytochrome c biogenesis protein ResB n=1 Tax=Exiguobacterium TaxID=33986 RepID=UPI0020368522|nr:MULTISPECIES: cytochrome c biogenesis protein ResB [Exiguobacterium]MCT4782167.1 cytochrome c biogenesis protein ResB [Exiguobacterium himgiriensis]